MSNGRGVGRAAGLSHSLPTHSALLSLTHSLRLGHAVAHLCWQAGSAGHRSLRDFLGFCEPSSLGINCTRRPTSSTKVYLQRVRLQSQSEDMISRKHDNKDLTSPTKWNANLVVATVSGARGHSAKEAQKNDRTFLVSGQFA